jgi:hypothetical protein
MKRATCGDARRSSPSGFGASSFSNHLSPRRCDTPQTVETPAPLFSAATISVNGVSPSLRTTASTAWFARRTAAAERADLGSAQDDERAGRAFFDDGGDGEQRLDVPDVAGEAKDVRPRGEDFASTIASWPVSRVNSRIGISSNARPARSSSEP